MSRHHQQIRNDPRWKAARSACLDRDGHACVGYQQPCGSVDRLQVDHVIELHVRPDLAFDLDNLQTLCHDCHTLKGRDDDAGRLIRNTWLNPAYPELQDLIETEKETDGLPVF